MTSRMRWISLFILYITCMISSIEGRWYVQQYCADSACEKPTLTNVRVLDLCIPKTFVSNPVLANCNSTHLSIFPCNSDCTLCNKENATLTVIRPLETAIQQIDGSFNQWKCLQDFPAVPSDSRVIVTYDNNQCIGKTTYDNFVIGFTRPRCAPTASAFFDTSCSSNMFTSSRCSDSTCSTNCNTTITEIPVGCSKVNQTILCGSSYSLPKVSKSSLMSIGMLQVVFFVLSFIYQNSWNKE